MSIPLAAPNVDLDQYTFDGIIPAAVVEHVGCGWRYGSGGETVEQLVDAIREHHDTAHATATAATAG